MMEKMTEQEKWQYETLDEENKNKLNIVLKELRKYVDDENISMLTELKKETIESFLLDNNVNLYNSFIENIKTPFSIMRYLSLYDDEEKITNKLNNFISKHKQNDFDFFIIKQFKNEILFNAKEKGELKVKYTYNVEKDSFDFYLIGNLKGFKISFDQILNLLTNNFVKEDFKKTDENTDEKVSLLFNGMKIIIEKQ